MKKMDKKTCMKLVSELLKDLTKTLEAEASGLFSSGAVDPEKYLRHEYLLPKLILTAALHRQKNAYSPPRLRKDLWGEINNLKMV